MFEKIIVYTKWRGTVHVKAQLISTHSSLGPSQRQPSLSQPVCQRQTVFVNDSVMPLRHKTVNEKEKLSRSRRESSCLVSGPHAAWRHFTSWGCELPPSSLCRLWLHGRTSEGCILKEGEGGTHCTAVFSEQTETSLWRINAEDCELFLQSQRDTKVLTRQKYQMAIKVPADWF